VLAGRVIASHYAEPVERLIACRAVLRSAPSNDAEVIGDIGAGEEFTMLDDTLGWAWGYAGKDRRVGYVSSEAVSAS